MYKQLRSWGFTRRAISTSLIVSGVWNVLARLLLPVVAIVVMLMFAGDLNPAVMKAAGLEALGGAVVLGLFVTMLVSERACRSIGGWLHRSLQRVPSVRRAEVPLDEHLMVQRTQTISVVRTGWLSMTFGMVGFFGMNYLLFWFCLNTVGAAPVPYMFFAFALSRLLTSVTITWGSGVRDRRRGAARRLGCRPCAGRGGGGPLLAVRPLPRGAARGAGVGRLVAQPQVAAFGHGVGAYGGGGRLDPAGRLTRLGQAALRRRA